MFAALLHSQCDSLLPFLLLYLCTLLDFLIGQNSIYPGHLGFGDLQINGLNLTSRVFVW